MKDRFGLKPLVVAETDDFVAIATEEIALRRVLTGTFQAVEPPPDTMQVWQVARPAEVEAKGSIRERKGAVQA